MPPSEDWIALDSLQDNEYNYRINICHDILYKGYNAVRLSYLLRDWTPLT